MSGRIQQFAATVLLMSGVGWAAADTGAHLAALESAVGRGDPGAQTELAVRYEHAEGLPQDFQKANALYCQAARQGSAEAQFSLGWLYANGRGVPRDDGVAAALFEMAADQGHEHAGRLLKYIHQQPDVQLPSCLLPDPPLAIANENFADNGNSAPDDNIGGERSEVEQLVYRLAPKFAVDPKLALAVISVESAFNPDAISPKNAQGLMQLIPETAERFGVKSVFNPVENIKGGLAYLRWLLAFFRGNVALVAAAYNAGERAVEKYRGIPPYAETRRYVRKITGIYTKASHPYEPNIVEPSLILARVARTRD